MTYIIQARSLSRGYHNWQPSFLLYHLLYILLLSSSGSCQDSQGWSYKNCQVGWTFRWSLLCKIHLCFPRYQTFNNIFSIEDKDCVGDFSLRNKTNFFRVELHSVKV